MTTVLVTGGAGFIGSCFVRHELKKHPDYKIINLDALTYCGNLENLKDVENNPNYKFVHGNICDRNLVRDLVKEADLVVNFAAESHVDNSSKHPEIFVETNVQGTLNLLQASKELGVERYLQVSTDEVYGTLGKTGYFYETTPLAPNSPYSASKASADMLVRAYRETYGLPTLNTRCSNNYGPYQYPEKLIPFFISQLLKGEKLTQILIQPQYNPLSVAQQVAILFCGNEGYINDVDDAALEEQFLIEECSRMSESELKQFLESDLCEELVTEGKMRKNTIVLLSGRADMDRRTKMAALQLAKDNNDPLWGEIKKLRTKERSKIAKIMQKYGHKAQKKAKSSQKDWIRNRMPANFGKFGGADRISNDSKAKNTSGPKKHGDGLTW